MTKEKKMTIYDYLTKFDMPHKDNIWIKPIKNKDGSYTKLAIVKHKALERLADLLDIEVELGSILNSDYNSEPGSSLGKDKSHVALVITGKWKEKRAWSIGESSPANNTNPHAWAMAEKRGIDRVIMKLLGVYGDVYSEAEAEEFNKPEEADKKYNKKPDQKYDIKPPASNEVVTPSYTKSNGNASNNSGTPYDDI